MTHAGTVGAALAGAIALLRDETASPQIDAEVLLAHVLKRPRAALLAHRTDALAPTDARAFTSFVRRRAAGIPLPYLTGTNEFYGRPCVVTPAVMVPRPESEAVVDEALHLLDAVSMPRDLGPMPQTIVADIGTGSGVLAVTIAAEAPRARVVATDKSAAALTVARRNARKHKVARRITFIESDLLTEIPPDLAPTILVANLPYVPSDELKRAGDSLETRGLTFEPPRALDGGPDGLFVIRRFFAQVKKLFTFRSPLSTRLEHVVLEHSPSQRRRILELARDALPSFEPHDVTPFVTSWTRKA